MKVVPRKHTKIPTLKQEGLLRHKNLHARPWKECCDKEKRRREKDMKIRQHKGRLLAKGHSQRMMWNQADAPLQLAGTLKVALTGHT